MYAIQVTIPSENLGYVGFFITAGPIFFAHFAKRVGAGDSHGIFDPVALGVKRNIPSGRPVGIPTFAKTAKHGEPGNGD